MPTIACEVGTTTATESSPGPAGARIPRLFGGGGSERGRARRPVRLPSGRAEGNVASSRKRPGRGGHGRSSRPRGRWPLVLWAAATAAVASVLPLRAWSSGPAGVLVAAAGPAAGSDALRVTLGARLAPWSRHVDVGLGNLLVSLVAGAGASEHVGPTDVYLLVPRRPPLPATAPGPRAPCCRQGGRCPRPRRRAPPGRPTAGGLLSVLGTTAALGGRCDRAGERATPHGLG